MVTVGVLKENVDAVIDKTKLTQQDLDVLQEYAQATCPNGMPIGRLMAEAVRKLT